MNLKPIELEQLVNLVATSKKPAFRQRAQILIMYHEGAATREISREVQLSPSRVRYWRRQFEQKGMTLFTDGEPIQNGQSREPEIQTGTSIPTPLPDLTDTHLYLNRELSLLAFQYRVLEEAQDERNPLLERIKFLGIVGSNLDEFFMVRVGGIKQQIAAGVTDPSPDGRTPAEQLASIRRVASHLMQEARTCFLDVLMPRLNDAGIHLLQHADLNEKQLGVTRKYFQDVIFPVLTPMAFDPGHPFPHISNLSLNLAVVIRDQAGVARFARLKVPGSIPRLLPIKRSSGGHRRDGTVAHHHYFVWVEQVIAANLADLFPGMEIVASYPFRVTRNADLIIQELEADDLLETMEASVRRRQFGSVDRLEITSAMPDDIRDIFLKNLGIDPNEVYTLQEPLGLKDLMNLYGSIERHDLRDTPFLPVTSSGLKRAMRDANIFKALQQKSYLLHHPYDSFDPVIAFLEQAAEDPQVLAIKQTLYRVGRNSPVVKALLQARKNDKQVAVLVELKARFDEESNIDWAKKLEREGVHVVYGLLGLKTHSKIALVVRKEDDRIRRYVHLSTGNYNAVTAHLYEDLGYFTTDEAIGADASDLFNYLTGYSTLRDYRKLIVAPINLRNRIESLIRREIEHQNQGRGGHMILKSNSLVDVAIIRLLYEASQAGVKIELIVRGICCLRPGVPGLSENITVRSIVGRFLEHSRIYYFRNGGDESIYMGSADLMPRNLDRRVEVLFPIEDPTFIRYLHHDILGTYLSDNVKARLMRADGTYERIHPESGQEPIDAQNWFLNHRLEQNDYDSAFQWGYND